MSPLVFLCAISGYRLHRVPLRRHREFFQLYFLGTGVGSGSAFLQISGLILQKAKG